jgi:hypothetical protein
MLLRIVSFGAAPKMAALSDGDERIVLLPTYLDNWRPDDDLGGRDAYLGAVPGMLRDQGIRILRLGQLICRYRDAVRVRMGGHPWLFAASFAKISDWIRALGGAIALMHTPEPVDFQGISVSGLFRSAIRRDLGREGFYLHQVWYYAMLRLADRSRGVRVTIVYPYENLQWERLLCLAFRQKAPHVRIVGHQHSSVPPLLLNYWLSAAERRGVTLPHVVLATSDLMKSRLELMGHPRDFVLVGGSPRYQGGDLAGSRSGDRHEDARISAASSQVTVLVALPLSRPHAAQLLGALTILARGPVADREGTEYWLHYLIRPHPWLSLRRIGVKARHLPEGTAVATGTIAESISSSHVFLYVAPTTTCFEALAEGLQVVRFVPDLLDIDACGDGFLAVRSCTGRDLARTLGEACHIASTARPERGASEGDSIFAPIAREVWLRAIGADAC